MLKASDIKFRIDATEKRANKVDLYYAIIFWESPITPNQLNWRVGYFEDFNELDYWVNRMHELYNIKFKFPYKVVSNVDEFRCNMGLEIDYTV